MLAEYMFAGAELPSRPLTAAKADLRRWNGPMLRPFAASVSDFRIREPPVRILVVEDDPLIREFVVEALREEGYEVIHAATGEEALAWCGRRIADVLATDVRLPGRVDGWQIAERCREQDPELAVIYASGFSPVAPRPVSCSLFLQKPYDPADIVRAVKTLGRRDLPN
jgi:DNA-binding response OmpR family regulator